jgi:polysaccharide biosynthesis PFTS motif protein
MEISYLERFEDLKKYNKIYIVDNLKAIPKHIDSQNLYLLYPNIRFIKKKNFLSDNIKNLPLSIFNQKYSFKWQSHTDALDFVEINQSASLINFLNTKIINFLIGDYSKSFIKNFNCRILEKYFFYRNIIIFFKTYNQNIFSILTLKELDTVHNYLKRNKPSYFCKEIKILNIFSKQNFNFLKLFFVLFFPIKAIFKSKKISIKKKENIKNCIRQYSAGFGVNFDPLLSEDWIVDDKYFTKKNTLFVLEEQISYERKVILNKKNYISINANYNNPIHFFCIKNFTQILFKYCPIFFFQSIVFIFSNFLNQNLIYNFLRDCLIWDNFCINFKNVKYLTYHNFHSSHFIRNYFLNKTGSKIFLYKHSFSENVFDENTNLYGNSIFFFNHHDYEFHMSQLGIEMSLRNKSLAKKFYISGPVWSSNEFSSNINLKVKKNNVLAFTSSLSHHGVNSLKTHLGFFKYLLEIKKLNKDIKLTIKTKYNLSNYMKIKDFSEILKRLISIDENIFIENKIRSRLLIDQNNIIISMPFSTPGFEALYLKKKVFFADISGHYKNSLISKKTKHFVSSGYEDSINMFNKYYNENIDKLTIFQNAKNIFGETLNYDPANYIRKRVYEA